MADQFQRPQLPHQYSRGGFQPLSRGDATIDIPLQPVSQHNQGPSAQREMSDTFYPEKNGGSTATSYQGMRKSRMFEAHHKPRHRHDKDEVTKMGVLYRNISHYPTIVRYMLYVVPVGIIIAIPIIVGATGAQGATIGDVRIVWFFTWIECCWVGLWLSKLVAHWLPNAFQFLCGIVSSGTRKYATLLRALEIHLSMAGWALVGLATFKPIMTRNPDTRALSAQVQSRGGHYTIPHWINIVEQILAAALISTLIFLGERILIQLISINYHRKQFAAKIRESKHHVYLLGLLYDASRAMFPPFCAEFAEEDAIIGDTLELAFSDQKKKFSGAHHRSGSSTPMRLLRDVGRLGDKVTSAFGNIAHEVTGKNVFNPDSAHSIVVTALEKTRSSEALARRLWLSFVVEGHDALYLEDIQEVLGDDRQTEAEECFVDLDRDGNGDVSLDEMILTVTEYSRERYSIANSMSDVDQAINVLDQMLCTVVFIVCIFIFVAFLNTAFITTLATAGTALISLSFVFSVTAQEILGSCIFLFVKHPYDIGDRVDLMYGTDQLVVEHISLLFTVFRRVTNHRTVQIPNIVLNTLWVENVSRSKAMREQLTISVSFDTTLEDVQLLRNEMARFVADKENSRDFQPDIDLEIVGVGAMDKLELQVEIRHKSNWANDTVRAARRSRFICALVLAMRKIPIYGPAGGDPALGAPGNPSYSVAVSDAEAARARDNAAKEREASRMVPTKKTVSPQIGTLTPISEERVIDMLHERSPALDGARDNGARSNNGTMDLDRVGSESQELEEVRGMLRRATTKGKRKSDKTTGLASTNPEVPTTIQNVGSNNIPSSRFNMYRQQANDEIQRNSLDQTDHEHLNEEYYIPSSPSATYLGPGNRY